MATLTDDMTLYEQAVDALSRGDLKQASGLCKMLMEQSPASAQAHHLMSSLFRATGNFRKAYDYASQAAQLDDCVASYHMQQGHLLFALRHFEQAAEAFRRANELAPGDVESLIWLGNCMCELEHFDVAQSWYEKAQAISSDHHIILASAECYMKAGESDRAETMVLALLEKHSQLAEAHLLFSKLSLLRGDFDRAHHALTRASRSPVPPLLVYFFQALLAIHQQDDRQAVASLLQLLKVDPTHVPSLLLLGNVFLNMDEMEPAKKAFHHVLAFVPYHLLAWQGLLQIATDETQLADTLQQLHHASQQSPEAAQLKHLRALYRGDVPPRAPKEYVAQLYDNLVQAFDVWVAANQDEKLAREISRIVRAQKELVGKRLVSLLDIGCHSGGVARQLADITAIRVGVDLSAQLLKLARRSKQYDVLYELDAVDYVLASESVFDVIVVSGALRWMGNLQPFFHALRNVMHHNSICVFITSKEPSTLAYTVGLDGRYQHSPAYIRDVTNAEGLVIVTQKDLLWLNDDATLVPKSLTIIKKTTLH